jgi:hypothetical protein
MKKPTQYQFTQACHVVAGVICIGGAFLSEHRWLAILDGFAAGFMFCSAIWNVPLRKWHRLCLEMAEANRDLIESNRDLIDVNQALIRDKVVIHFQGGPDVDPKPSIH